MAQWVAVFAAAAAVVAWAGVRLARAGDELAERAGLSRLFVGMVLVAAATSLPEIVTDISAALEGAPDLAVGDLFGSSMANMAILAVIDLMRRQRVWARVEIGHARVASIAIALTALATLAILTPPGVTLGWVGLDTIAIGAAYLAAVAWVRRSPDSRFGPVGMLPVATGWTEDEPEEATSVGQAARRFAGAALLILIAAPVLALAGREIAGDSQSGQTFVGAALLAAATSMPELVASIAAVRIGAHDLAVGNLFGSNAFNMFALVLVDLADGRGALLSEVAPGQAVGGVGAILLMALALAAIVHGAETRVRRLEPDAILLLVVYAGALLAVWSIHT